jgi:hypothetical protein
MILIYAAVEWVFPQIHANQTNLRGEVGFFEKRNFFPRK